MRKLDNNIASAIEVVADESSSAAALIDTKDDYRIIWANKRLKNFLKTVEVSPVGLRWGGRCPFAFGINALEVMDEVVRTGKPVRAEERPFGARVSSRFGETTYWNWKALPAMTEECPGCAVVMAENVTDRVARRESERRWQPVFSGVMLDLPVGVAVLDPPDFRILDANDIWLSYLPSECQTKESIGKTLPECMPYFEYSGLADILRKVKETRELFAAHEFELRDPVRGSIWWSLSVRFVDIGGSEDALLVTAFEVSEQVNARRRIEKSRRRAQAMLQVQNAISSSLALDEVLNLITNYARELMNSPAASVFLLSDDKKSFVPKGAVGIELTEAGIDTLTSTDSLAARALRDKRPVAVSRAMEKYGTLPPLTSGRSIAAMAAAPVEAQDTQIGVIEVYNDEDLRFTNDELETLNTLASSAATAIINARLYEDAKQSRDRERHIAKTLQDALLPQVRNVMDGLHLSAVYEAGLEEAELGGDFYDVFSPEDGKLVLIIGDVAGKGLAAAVQIAAAKYGIRSHAYENPSPSHVVSRVNEALYYEQAADVFVSLFYGVVDVKTGIMVYANAGHEPPLLRKQDGRVIKLTSDGIVMGVDPKVEYEERTCELEPGDRLLLYTDGVTEARKESGEMLGEDRLTDYWAKKCPDGAEESLRALYEWAKEFSEGHFHDDVAMLVVAVAPP
ncbi:MAG: SpoIIE family protein phosphatase [Armatimonadetes bacterium]|nr:SpoIIE family protein phosphatase [Armatimonadota bacterium]